MTGSLLPALALVCTHLFAHHLKRLDGVPRSRWLSAAGGASVAYVFLHLLPEIAHGQEAALDGFGALEERLAWLLALVGLVGFYALDVLVRRQRDAGGPALHHEGAHRTGPFWVHLGSFALYNVITGFLLTEEGGSRVLFALALALHFLVVDYGLREDQLATWRRIGRWVVSSALLAGWLVGVLATPPEALIFGLIAFLGGGIVLNVLKEELPEERRSRLLPFLGGAAGYAGLLLAT